MSCSLRIGVFDSGLGGLSVLRHLRTALPQADYLYVADSAYAPYGNRQPDWILARSLQIAHYLEAQDVDAILIACNTATAHAVDAIRAAIDLPVIAMEPAIRPAIQCTQSGKIGVLATRSTLNSERFLRLKKTFASDYQYFELACHQWVEAIENHLNDTAKQQLVTSQLQALVDVGVDTYVLACTHFPFLMPQIQRAVPAEAKVIDPSEAVVRQLLRCLPESVDQQTEGHSRLLSSGSLDSLEDKLQTLIDFPITVVALPQVTMGKASPKSV